MRLLDGLRRLLGITPYAPNVPRALCRAPRTGGARAPKRNGFHGPYAPPGLTPQEEQAIRTVEQAQKLIRDRIALDRARRCQPG